MPSEIREALSSGPWGGHGIQLPGPAAYRGSPAPEGCIPKAFSRFTEFKPTARPLLSLERVFEFSFAALTRGKAVKSHLIAFRHLQEIVELYFGRVCGDVAALQVGYPCREGGVMVQQEPLHITGHGPDA